MAAGKAIGYVGAGTVEFILDESAACARGDDPPSTPRENLGREFFFLEVNTRLQVEHPVTEMVTGLDLVALQVLVAEGKPLPPGAVDAALSGHAIEARLYAEDVAAGYLPSTGRLHRFEIPQLAGVRIDAGYRSGGEVSVHYDPMLAKVIAHAPTREQAARLLARALREARLHGVVTNRDLLVGILREDEFLAGQIDTGYLTRHAPADLMAADPRRDEVHAIAVALADQAHRRVQAPVLAAVPSGWRNVPNSPQQVGYASGAASARGATPGSPEGTLAVSYRVITAASGTRAQVCVNGGAVAEVVLHACTPDLVDMQADGIRRVIRVARDGATRYADSSLGASVLTEQPRFPLPESAVAAGSLVAPMPGTVVRVEVSPGGEVSAGQVLVVLEAMKMEHSVRAPHHGTVAEVRVTAGQSVDQGTVLAVLHDAGAQPAEEAP